MGAKGATEILYRAELGDKDKIAARTAEYEDRFANPFVAAERGFIDDVIMPHSAHKTARGPGVRDAAGTRRSPYPLAKARQHSAVSAKTESLVAPIFSDL